MCVSYSILFYPGRSVKPVLMLQKRGARASRAYRRQKGAWGAAHIAFLNERPICNVGEHLSRGAFFQPDLTPPGIFTTVDDRLELGAIRDAQIKIVATRRMGARLQHADLYCEGINDGDVDFVYFGYQDIPNSSSAALRWFGEANECSPGLTVTWNRHSVQQDLDGRWRQHAPSTINARFSWCNPDIDDMPLADACLTLEHYVDWK